MYQYAQIVVELYRVFKMPTHHFGTEQYGRSHFGRDVSSREHFGMCTLLPCGRSGRWTFQHRNVWTWGLFSTGNFWCEEFLALWTFQRGIFCHLNISAHIYFGTLQSNMDVLAQTFWHLCYCEEMSQSQNVPAPKTPHAEKSST